VVSRALTNQRLAVLARIDLSDACESGLARHEACESFQLSTRVMRSIVEICATGRARGGQSRYVSRRLPILVSGADRSLMTRWPVSSTIM
jgi:hypothetical protein